MHKSFSSAMITITFILMFSYSLHAQQSASGKLERPQKEFVVQVDVREIDGDMKLSVKSYISRHLRELRDVKVSDTKPDFTICVDIIPVDIGDVRKGYILYVIPLYNDPRTNQEVFLNRAWYSSPPENIEQNCQKLVAAFDQTFLEPLR